jgi:hypothetical protein
MSNKLKSLKKSISKLPIETLKISLYELINSVPAINDLIAQPLPVQSAFKISKIAKTIQTELDSYNEVRGKLLNEFGTLSEDGIQYEFADDNKQKFETNHRELLNSEVELMVRKLKIQELHGANTSATNMMLLSWLIEDEN